ncbi:ABC transporter permease [Pediococcus pentosaceus]|uniref:ABC transporter permease n=1 Tax=Pediococcus pentosaceus TaxID=1255 RepID=UPI0007626D5C|nr:ABC transporter permease [Pediococcus pentosaceus]NEZ69814.1 FtsX-like permease family protein [Pediococcus pentosaceus]
MNKLLMRDIRGSLGRFTAIVLIIMLGVLLFVGVKATGPALNHSMQSEVVKHHLSDVQVFSDKGFTRKDIKAVERVQGAKAESIKFKYVIGGKTRDAIALYGLKDPARQNQVILKSGRLPQKNNEILLDKQAQIKDGYRIGDQFTFAKSANLKVNRYKIVGFADSPLYIDDSTRGSANVGSGQVQYFAYIKDQAINLPVATAINISFAKLQHQDVFSGKYQGTIKAKVKLLQKQLDKRKNERKNEIVAKPLNQLNRAQEKLNQAKQKIVQAKAQLKKQSGGKVTTTSELDKQEQQLAETQVNLKRQRKKVEKIKVPSYTWQTREDLPGFTGYGDSSDRIAAIANVFPVFFFLLAALITFTTITRMVEEARGQIGTLKALGFSRSAIAYEYTMYAFLAGILGVIVGSFLGNQLLPRFVVSMYTKYVIGQPVIEYDWASIAIAVVLAMIATVGAALLVVIKETKAVPAELLRPKSPRKAKKILLENISFIWKRLNFNQKISYRNLFRFKLRGLMTILGIAGGTALILTGFGIANSISATGDLQFNQIIKYDAVVQAKRANQLESVRQTIARGKNYQQSLATHTETFKATKHGKTVDDINMDIPQNKHQFEKFVTLRDYQNQHPLHLQKQGVIISEKLATALKVRKGSTISIENEKQTKKEVKVIGVTQNYVGNFMYGSTSFYRKIMKKEPTMQTLMVQLHQTSKKNQQKLSKQWIEANADILGVSFVRDQAAAVTSMSKQLGPVVLIFILLSGVLSFIVLYNLNNINISERLRELSTIKVLGFFDSEVTMYIARESIILALIGILAGFGLGNILTSYVIKQAETSIVVFPLTIKPMGYVVATVLMVIFNLIVVYITHRRLRQVDMVEALKSNE